MTGVRAATRAVIPAALAAAVVAVPALAVGAVDTRDGNDTRGPLDVHEVRLDDRRGALRWTFETFAGWTLERVWDRGYFVVRVDTRGDAGVDVQLVVRSDGRDLIGTLVDIRRDGREVERLRVPTDKVNRTAASVSVALRKLRIARRRTSLFWSALSIFTGSSCRRTCIDRVPDGGRVEQPLFSPSPSPTPSPSPSPSPTVSPSPSASPSP